MGVLNMTPDSFSDGGEFNDPEKAKKHILNMIAGGADIIDIGGESTGPGSVAVSADEELARVKPVIDFVHEHGLTAEAVFSIDTYKASVAEYALMHGFGMVNDVTALRGDKNMLQVLLDYKPYVVLMYSKDDSPRTTKEAIEYDDVMASIKTFLADRIGRLITAGFPEDKIIVDPGMGAFVSSIPDYSFEIIDRLAELKTLGYPILVGVSRKSFFGGDPKDRDAKSAQYSKKALKNGASIVRVHKVVL